MKSLHEHLSLADTKRILSLDGGGIRGALSLGILKNIEDMLKERFKEVIPPDSFRLHHYYDLIGGTSTGAIIAAALAIGMSVDEITQKYKELGSDIFQKGGCYRSINTIYYNFDFCHSVAIIIMKNKQNILKEIIFMSKTMLELVRLLQRILYPKYLKISVHKRNIYL